MSKSNPYDFGLLDTDLTNTFPTSAPNVLAGVNSNYSGLMPGGSFSSFGSGFDLNQLSKLDPMAQMVAIPYFMDNPEKKRKELEALLPTLENFYSRQAEKQFNFGLKSNLWGAAITSIANLPPTLAQSAAQVREGRLAGLQAILDQAQRPYNIGGLSMPYNTYRI